jgi:hypothetical protein
MSTSRENQPVAWTHNLAFHGADCLMNTTAASLTGWRLSLLSVHLD